MSDEPGTLHERHFSPEEANAVLESLKPLLQQLREARDELTDEEAHEALSEAAPGNGGGEPGHRVGVAFLEVRRLLEALEQSGIVLRDIDRGLIDFPALRDGREVYLCWQLGEDEVAVLARARFRLPWPRAPLSRARARVSPPTSPATCAGFAGPSESQRWGWR